jgi:3-oxoadipate enol-lactonase
VLVLLHGATLTAELNWSGAMTVLGRRYRVIALDQRGHGRGIPCSTFRLEDCADDVAALARVLGIDRLIPVGFSMGGLVAQLIWRRHPDLTAGLVLCSTARNVSGSPWERAVALMMPGVVAAAAFFSAMYSLGADVLGASLLDRDINPTTRGWAIAQMRHTPLLTALSTAQAVGHFTSHEWIGSVDVPTSVVITRNDRIVPARRQWKLAHALPDCTVIEIDGDHGVFLHAPGRFATAVLAACAVASEDRDRTEDHRCRADHPGGDAGPARAHQRSALAALHPRPPAASVPVSAQAARLQQAVAAPGRDDRVAGGGAGPGHESVDR